MVHICIRKIHKETKNHSIIFPLVNNPRDRRQEMAATAANSPINHSSLSSAGRKLNQKLSRSYRISFSVDTNFSNRKISFRAFNSDNRGSSSSSSSGGSTDNSVSGKSRKAASATELQKLCADNFYEFNSKDLSTSLPSNILLLIFDFVC